MLNYLAIDIGGTNIKYGVINSVGKILEKDKKKTIIDGEIIIKEICELYKNFSNIYKLEGIAISAPGIIDFKTGDMHTGGAIDDFEGFNLKKYLSEKLSIRVEICNDANCVALAEKWIGNARECKTFVALTIGTGIGGGIYINDSLFTGSGFMAGEFGFIVVDGINNKIPNESILGNYGSVGGLRKAYAKRIGKDDTDVSGEEVFTAYDNGEIHAKLLVDDFYNSLAIGLNNIFFILNPEKILIGGAISSREKIIEEIEKRLKILSFMGDRFVLDRCKFYNDSGIIGAVKHFRDMSGNKI